MPFRRSTLLPILSLFAVALAAAFDGLEGPSLGFVARAGGHTLRPIRGIPGAATWGALLDPGPDILTLAVAPRRNAALAVTPVGVRVLDLSSGSLSSTDPGLPTSFRPTSMAFSPGGAVAALYDGEARALWLLADGHARELNTAALSGAVSRLAVSEGPDPAAAAVLEATTDSVVALENGARREIRGFGDITAVAFLGRTRNLAIADAGARRLLLVRDPLSGGAPEVLLDRFGTRSARFSGPLDVASSANGKWLAVIVSASMTGLLDTDSGRWISFPCQCEGARLAPLLGNAVFAIERPEPSPAQPLWVLDGDASPPRMFFIPGLGSEERP